jgi:glycyl-tRNA synthetase beta subunit
MVIDRCPLRRFVMPDSKKLDYIQERIDVVVDTCNKTATEIALQKAALDSHTKQDEDMYAELKRMNNILQSNTESLKDHMANNILLKDMVQTLNKRLDPIELQFIERNAVKSWVVAKVIFIAKLSTAVAAVAGAWVYIKPMVENLLTHLLK